MAMPKIEFRCQMFRGDWDQVWSQRRMLWMMEALCRVNQTHLQEFEAFKKRGLVERNYPSIYRAGIHYETEKGTEIWPDIPSLYGGTMGKGVYPGVWGDCEDLSCARVAEYRELEWHYERPSKIFKGKVEKADPRFPQEPEAMKATKENRDWPGWRKVKGGIPAKPFAKWRRGPQGQYHYHALVFMPDGRLEDPSLVLGMGKEREFSEEGTVEKLKSGEIPVVYQYAKRPEVMVVDPEKPSGYNGGESKKYDEEILRRLRAEVPMSGDLEIGAYLGNPVGSARDDDEIDLDELMGWSRLTKQFVPYSDKAEYRRLLGYRNH
jgi:hypothetical protein